MVVVWVCEREKVVLRENLKSCSEGDGFGFRYFQIGSVREKQ